MAVTWPQVAPNRVQNWELVSGQPHMFAVPPPPQVSMPEQLPQSAMRDIPQLSKPVAMPQSSPCAAQNCWSVSGPQPQTLTVPPPPQLCMPVQVPQLAVRDTPQLSSALTLSQFFPSRVQ
jgi:hypothetical protein